MAADYETGQKMIRDRSFEDNAEYFATVFEIGRRHKILNPECMRTGTMCIQFCAPPPPFFFGGYGSRSRLFGGSGYCYKP